jgi:hypothetical protein
MIVETFEVEELVAEGEPIPQEQVELINQLQLTGQQELISKDDAGDENLCPYRKMTKEEQEVYGVLCPDMVKIEHYSAQAIPVRVLQVYAHAQSLDMFETFVVMDKKQAEVKDPVLVGMTGQFYSWQKNPIRGTGTFILARWGEELAPFSELKQMAMRIRESSYLAELDDIIDYVQATRNAVAEGRFKLSDRIHIEKNETEVKFNEDE